MTCAPGAERRHARRKADPTRGAMIGDGSSMAERVDEWTACGALTPEQVRQPLLGLIQPEVEFDMNLPVRL